MMGLFEELNLFNKFNKLSEEEKIVFLVHIRFINNGWRRQDLTVNFVQKMVAYTLQHKRHKILRLRMAVCPRTDKDMPFGAGKLTLGEYDICKWVGLDKKDQLFSDGTAVHREIEDISEEVVDQIDSYIDAGGSIEEFEDNIDDYL